MSLPRYREYKDSGAEWLGRVPAHWTLSKLRHFTRFTGGGTPSRDVPAYWNGDIPWVSPKDMKTERIIAAEEQITTAGLDNSTANLVELGRVLLVVRSGILKHTIPVAINAVAVALNQDMKALEFEADTCIPKFFMRWVQGLNDNLLLAWAKQGATVESIEHSYLADTVIPLPPPEEQSAIITFLDRETAKIDALIVEQEKLIDLLAEKRQATISHAVTKGLNPDAAMKDAGMARLGKVPAHWKITQLKRLCDRITDGAHISPETEGGTYSFVSTKDLDGESIDFDKCLLTSPSSFEYLQRTGCRPAIGDVLFSKDGTIGRTVVVRDSREFVVASSLIIITPSANMLDSDFLNYLCKSSVVSGQVEGFIKGAGLPRLSIQNLLKVVGLFPPMEEQQAISDHLRVETQKVDVLSAAAERAVALLKERRIALIAATVTGQIDVRNIMVQDGVIPEAIAA